MTKVKKKEKISHSGIESALALLRREILYLRKIWVNNPIEIIA